MTRKLFYEDPCLAEFSAKVVSCEQENDRWAVILDATAFYPEGGGQAADVGTLGAARVLDTRERGEEVVHFCDAPLDAGTEVAGKIDWAHRFDLMQQHTGEHIVSGIIHKMFGSHNVGFHMGSDVVPIDFDTPIPYKKGQVALVALVAVKSILFLLFYYTFTVSLHTFFFCFEIQSTATKATNAVKNRIAKPVFVVVVLVAVAYVLWLYCRNSVVSS